MYDELIQRLREPCQYENCVLCQKAADAIEGLSHAVDQMTEWRGNPWIPVTERLPDEREWVLCQCRAKIRMVLRLQNGYWHQDSQHEFMSGFVTHWMPLPDPPKAEEGE